MRLSVYHGSKPCSSLAQPPNEKSLQRITEHERLDHQPVGHPAARDQIRRVAVGDGEVGPSRQPRLLVVAVAAVASFGLGVPESVAYAVEVGEPDRVRPDFQNLVVTVDGNRELSQTTPVPRRCGTRVSNLFGRRLQRPALVAVSLVATLLLAGCGGGGGVDSTGDAEAWLRDRFTSDVMEINAVSCETAPRDSYLCSIRAVTRALGATTSTGFLDCERECVWRPRTESS